MFCVKELFTQGKIPLRLVIKLQRQALIIEYKVDLLIAFLGMSPALQMSCCTRCQTRGQCKIPCSGQGFFVDSERYLKLHAIAREKLVMKDTS